MVNGFFREISEEEIMSVNGGCGGGCNPNAAMMCPPRCDACTKVSNNTAKELAAGAVVGAVVTVATAGMATAAAIMITTGSSITTSLIASAVTKDPKHSAHTCGN